MRVIQSVTSVDAPLETVWAVLTDTASYGRWNPFITKLTGHLVPGSTLEVDVAPPGGRPMSFRPVVTEVSVRHKLEWLGKLGVRGIFDGRHSFVLEETSNGSTRLTQREEFSGFLVPLMPRLLENTARGFEAMNRALAEQAIRRSSRTVTT